MSRVRLNYDDGSGIDFNDEADALYHLKVLSYAGVVDLRDEETGDVVADRAGLLDKLDTVAHVDVGVQSSPGPETYADFKSELEGVNEDG